MLVFDAEPGFDRLLKVQGLFRSSERAQKVHGLAVLIDGPQLVRHILASAASVCSLHNVELIERVGRNRLSAEPGQRRVSDVEGLSGHIDDRSIHEAGQGEVQQAHAGRHVHQWKDQCRARRVLGAQGFRVPKRQHAEPHEAEEHEEERYGSKPSMHDAQAQTRVFDMEHLG